MKKNLMFVIPMVAIAVLLFMVRTTGMGVHIAASVIGLAILVVYALATKGTWKCKALEILHRVCYAIALISGIAIKAGCTFTAMSVVHKISPVLFAVLLIITEIHKLIKNK